MVRTAMTETIAIIGGGPAGLIAAQRLAEAGRRVTVYDRMPTVGRKFLMAGRGGLNLTHSEPLDRFVTRYGAAQGWMEPLVRAFTPDDLRAWCADLGIPTFVGSSGRVFPESLKASPLLRAWLARLGQLGVVVHNRHDWIGLTGDNRPILRGPEGEFEAKADATILALGGASWPRLGGDGGWVPILAGRGIAIAPLQPANAGVEIAWSPHLRDRFAGSPLKRIALTFAGRSVRGEAMIAATGLEGGAVYALGAGLREALAREGGAVLTLDLRPDMTAAEIADRLARAGSSDSAPNRLRRALSLTGPAYSLLREGFAAEALATPEALAAAIKAIPLRVTGIRPLDRAISTAGGIRLDALTPRLELKALPGVFACGEMLDWEAPTGGYLLQGCFATGVAAARGALGQISTSPRRPLYRGAPESGGDSS
ncbi:TIGR03862 family flavoprotein [Inquilinus limosus]|uniref:TIGR03862 family flavoprotein n=1 Tax=Inquilinus limosus TaxID=171674 RepID=UPI00040B2D31|nr:TIGR03862 family flavoprotein [Inquilinus limosus]